MSVIYQHPLAYLIGLEGLALLRGWAGDFDKEFVVARLAEVRRLLDHEELANHPGVDVAKGDLSTGYRQWSATYDEPRNSLFDADEPIVHEIVDALPAGDALDAACGTGRFAEHLAASGHRVIGADSSTDMLDVARRRVPGADFREGDLHALPVDDRAVDLVVCALALSHVQVLEPVMAEFARVLRPGGHLVISDAHHELVLRGSVVKSVGPSGEPGLVPTYRHTAGDVLRAALRAGLQVRRCEEPSMRPSDSRAVPPPTHAAPALAPAPGVPVGSWDEWPWSLLAIAPQATWAAWAIPPIVVWHFQRA